MKILVTGAKGFIGRNLIAELNNRGFKEIYSYDVDSDPDELDVYTKNCDFVFHLAGVNRPQKVEEFMQGNFGFTSFLLDRLKYHGNQAPILITSSIQALQDNPYGRSKKAGEELLFQYQVQTGALVYVYRLQNVFGKWCRPNYNSAVATFCHNVANDFPITVNDREHLMSLVYIDDVVNTFIGAMEGKEAGAKDGLFYIMDVYPVKLGVIADLIQSFKASRNNLQIPDMADPLIKKLYSTYLSYLPVDQFSYSLSMNADHRGSFTEFIKSPERGQVSVNISKPRITKGNHWHHTKNEKFVVVSGHGVIRFRKIDEEEIHEYTVSGEELKVVDIPPGYTHNITNIGESDLVTIMWASELFDPERP
ncbi:MAG: capsular polysaccharide biosynthesis protein CapF, partial [Bacillota bacterium]